FDLLVSERPYLGATHRKHANGLFFPKQWDREDGAVAYASCGAFRKLVASSREVVHMDSFAVHGGPSSSPSSGDWTPDEIDRNRSMVSFNNERPLFSQKDRRVIRLAQRGRRPHKRIQHHFEIEGRAADDLEH